MVTHEEGLQTEGAGHAEWVRWDAMGRGSQVALNLSSAWLHTQVSEELIPSAGASLSSLRP